VLPISHRPLRKEDLEAIEPWFDDAATQRWLGDRSWPRRLLGLAELPGRFAVAWQERGEVVALLDIERYGSGSAAIALVVSPAHRGEGIGKAILRSIFDLAGVEGVEQIYGEVEQGNVAAEGLVRAAGFVPANSAASEAAFNGWVLFRRSA
jgi:GNAT superfamily N-acetyltransferase